MFRPPVAEGKTGTGNLIVPVYTPKEGSFHYSNHPEDLTTAALGDANLGNKYVNRVDISASDKEVRGFASYANNSGRTLGFGWRFHNPGPSAVTLTILRKGFGDSKHQGGWDEAILKPWRDYWETYLGTTVPVPAGGEYWLRWDNMIDSGYIFCAVCLVKTTGLLRMYAYAYADFSNINGTATRYRWSADPTTQYSGKGDTHYMYADRAGDLHVNMSQLPMYFDFAGCDGSTTDDMVPIYDTEDGIWFRCCDAPPRNNIGNWGISSHHRIRFHNDLPDPVTIEGWIGSCGGSDVYVHIVEAYNDGLHLTAGEMWHFVNFSLAPGTSETLEFVLTKGTNSAGRIRCFYRLP